MAQAGTPKHAMNTPKHAMKMGVSVAKGAS
jgi:hypothetical protein